MAEQQETPQPPNVIFYEVLTGTLDTGQEVLVQIFRRPNGTITLAQIAFRAERWQTWSAPTRLNFEGSHPTGGAS